VALAGLKFFKRNLFACLQEVTSSLRLFKVSSASIISKRCNVRCIWQFYLKSAAHKLCSTKLNSNKNAKSYLLLITSRRFYKSSGSPIKHFIDRRANHMVKYIIYDIYFYYINIVKCLMAPENGRWNSGVTCELFVGRLLVRVTQKFNVKTFHITTTALNRYFPTSWVLTCNS